MMHQPTLRFAVVATLLCLLVAAPWCLSAEKTQVPPKVEPFDLNQVRLLDGPCKTALEANRKYLHELDFDRMLYAFRITAGLPAPGKPLGGWEEPKCEVRGHFIGHYLSACALIIRNTGDEKLKAKADAMVAEFAKCQKAMGGEYLAAYPQEFWNRLEAMAKPPWAPYYTIHKIMAGLYDMYDLTGNTQALDVLKGMASYFKKRIDKLPRAQWDRILTVEFGGMSEVLHNLHSVTDDAAHFDLACKFDQGAFLGPLALEWDNLSGIHANTNIPKVIGAARRYELTGDERYRTISRFFWDCVVHKRSYATGGSNRSEHWPEPNALAATLAADNQECCTTYNMLKLTRHLIQWTAEPGYADLYERAFYNGILGTQRASNGQLIYFVPLGTGHTKKWGTPNDSFWCCYGTGIESFAKLADSIYFHDEEGVYVNLYIPSELTWEDAGLKLTQQTQFPEKDTTTLTLNLSSPQEGALHLRVPWWATRGIEVKVNGQAVESPNKPSSYLTLKREWKDGDKVEVRLPMSLYTQPMPDDPELRAILYGPLVLVGLTRDARYFLGDPKTLDTWIKPVEGKPLTFQTSGQPTDVTLVPFYKVLDEPYGAYWLFLKEGSERLKAIAAAEEIRKKRLARVVDMVIPNDTASESAHNLRGENHGAGAHLGRTWRHAPDGWFSYDLKVLPNAAQALVITYWGSEGGSRTFDVVVNGKVIATQKLNNDKPNEFFDVEHALTPEILQGKERITVMFKAHKGNIAGGVFECAIMKPQ